MQKSQEKSNRGKSTFLALSKLYFSFGSEYWELPYFVRDAVSENKKVGIREKRLIELGNG